MKKLIASFARDKRGSTAIEYALIAAVIGLALVASATAVGTNISQTFNTISATFASAS